MALHAELVRGFSDELQKLAKTRYEKEIEKGTISRGQVARGAGKREWPSVLGAAQRKLTRRELAAPANRTASEVAGKRRMAEHLYEAQSALPGPGGAEVHRSFSQAGPATAPGIPPLGTKTTVYAPFESGAFLRRATGGPISKMRAGVSLVPGVLLSHPQIGEMLRQSGELGVAEDIAGIASHAVLGKRAPVDPTLTHAVLRHELGEAGGMAEKPILNVADHIGPRPILEEQMALRGEPEAQKFMAKVRGDKENTLVQKLIRQAGGTPDAPLPIGGKGERAVERMLARRVGELSPATRQSAILSGLFTEKPVGYLPEGVTLPSHAQLESSGKEIMRMGKERDIAGLAGAGKEGIKKLWRLRKFIKSGV